VDFEPMSPDEMQRTMQFLLRQQAQFESNFEKLLAKVERIGEGLVALTGVVGRGSQTLFERMEQLTERMDRLTEAQQRTDDHLNVVIEMFERHLREDHGHGPS
jgi:hypothetical protein